MEIESSLSYSHDANNRLCPELDECGPETYIVIKITFSLSSDLFL
jgi:hypothetical protein